MSVELVNGIIARTEYAADLLRQYKLVAGNGMYVEPHYDGTRVSYLQPVAGGATPAQPISPAYRIVGQATVGGITKGFLYNGSTFTDIIYPGATGTRAYAIDGSSIVGVATGNFNPKGFLYNGSTFTDIIYPGASQTEVFGIDGSNIVGLAQVGFNAKGFLYNGSTFTDLNYGPLPPNSQLINTQPFGIDGSNIVGLSALSISGQVRFKGFLYDGSNFTDIVNPDPSFVLVEARDISGLNIVGSTSTSGNLITKGFLYNGSTFTYITYPGETSNVIYGIDGSNIVGQAVVGGASKGFLYDGSTFVDISYPGATSTLVFGIG
jgi:hypothetical protein